jgi:rabenosyn-5
MRKRLMEAFAQYDVLAKRIRKLPCPSGPGSSQDRVQMAVMTRANLFLQMNMVPLQVSLRRNTISLLRKMNACLQSLSTPTRDTTVTLNLTSINSDAGEIGGHVDADSKVALALQPLLEQEALLESFVEEAQAQRKFEDVKTLKVNLGEIRAEIERIFAEVQDGI